MLQPQRRLAPRSTPPRRQDTGRMVIVGGEAMFTEALQVALRMRYAPGVSVSCVDAHGDLDDMLREGQPDVVVIDAEEAGDEAVDRILQIRAEAPDAAVLLFAGDLAAGDIEAALDAGATVCLSRAGRVADVTPLHGGRPITTSPPAPMARPKLVPSCVARLTDRERDILGAVAEGQTNAQIGRDRYVTEQTVKFHLSNIYRKLGVANRTEASRFALLNNLCGDALATAG